MSAIFAGCKNYFFGPTTAPTLEQSLEQAVRKNKWEEVDQLLQTGANPTAKDNYGYSVIDYAIWDGQTQKLPHLLGQKHEIANVKVDQQTLTTFAKFLSLTEKSKNAISQLPVDKILEGTHTSEYAEFKKLLNEYDQVTIPPLNSHFIHLLAAYADPKIIFEALKLHPEWSKLVDNQGHSILHYAAFNANENTFVELVKNGANLFLINSKGETALSLFIDQIQKRDPLSWNSKDVYLFLQKWVAQGVVELFTRGLITFEFLQVLSLPMMILDMAAMGSYFSMFLDPSKSKLQKFLIALAYAGTSWVPIVNIPIHAYITYCFVKNAYKGLQHSWQHLSHRPLQAICTSFVKLSNAKDQVDRFSMHWKIADFVAKVGPFAKQVFDKFDVFKTNVEGACGECPQKLVKQIPISLYDSKEYKTMADYAKCANKQFAQTFEQELEDNTFVKEGFNLYRNFADEAATECAPVMPDDENGGVDPLACFQAYAMHHFEKFFASAGADAANAKACQDYSAPWFISSYDLKGRLERIDKPECLQAAKDILQGMNCRKALASMHPDKHQAEHDEYEALYQKLASACDTLKQARA